MDVLIEPVVGIIGAAAGAAVALLAVRHRKRIPPVNRALDSRLGISDHEHIYDRMINDGRGWKCACGARYDRGR